MQSSDHPHISFVRTEKMGVRSFSGALSATTTVIETRRAWLKRIHGRCERIDLCSTGTKCGQPDDQVKQTVTLRHNKRWMRPVTLTRPLQLPALATCL